MPDVLSDELLLTRIAVGDREAFADLFRRRHRDVYRFALHVCGAPSVADDVVQDVFVAVIGAAAAYRPERSAALPWLLGIARNHVRRRADRDRPFAPWGEDAPAPDSDPAAGVAKRELVAAVRQALATLPVGYREAIALCDLQELSYADAAAALGCAVGTVRSRLHRGRALLADRLRAGHEDEARGFSIARWLL